MHSPAVCCSCYSVTGLSHANSLTNVVLATVTAAAITDVLSTGVDVAVGACTGSFLISILAAVVLDTLIPGVLGVSGVVGAEEVVGVETEFGLLLLPL